MENTATTKTGFPASFIILGDHTHYNEGIQLSWLSQIKSDAHIEENNSDTTDIHLQPRSGNNIDFSEHRMSNELLVKLLTDLTYMLPSNNPGNPGCDIVLKSDIPFSFGLGGYAALQASVIKSLAEKRELKLKAEHYLSMLFQNEVKTIGKISNQVHHQTVVTGNINKFYRTDLRRKEFGEFAGLPEDLIFAVFDTGKIIKDIKDTCNDRIEECTIGVDGLSLYMWGIKNLRDVKKAFLKSHDKIIPALILKRVKYYVEELERVEAGLDFIENGDYAGLGKLMFESHNDLDELYNLHYPAVNFLVTKAKNIPGILGSKLITCSPVQATINLIEREYSESVFETADRSFYSKYGKHLKIYVL